MLSHFSRVRVCHSVWPQRWQPIRLPRPWDSPGKNTGVGCHFLLQCMKVKRESEVAQSCLTLSNPMDRSLPGSSSHGIFQARVLEWVAIAFSMCQPSPPHIFLIQSPNFNQIGIRAVTQSWYFLKCIVIFFPKIISPLDSFLIPWLRPLWPDAL